MKESKSFYANNNRLNKGYLKIGNPRESDNSFYRKKFDHVLPPIELMEQYEEIHPGTLAKLMIMAEKEQKHRQQMDIKAIEEQEHMTQKSRISSIIFMALICMTILLLTVLGHFIMAVIFVVSVCCAIVVGLVVSSTKFTRRKDYIRK
jgi:uncharacterized membrane protein